MFGPFIESWQWLKAHNPGSPFKKRHLSFITIHYMYLMGLGILGSVLLFPAGGLNYIDALYLSAGAATQSGLNTVNLNEINTYQQVVLYFIAMVSNPIWINTFVVFLRLYWFEKRFQNVVKEAQIYRRSLGRSRTNTQAQEEETIQSPKKGVNGRSIVVLHPDKQVNDKVAVKSENEPSAKQEGDKSRTTSTQDGTESEDSLEKEKRDHFPTSAPPRTPTFRREITFADEIGPRSDLESPIAMPKQLSTEQQIAFLENQRNPKDKSSLRIPGPRDFDRGDVPKAVEHEDENDRLPNHQNEAPEAMIQVEKILEENEEPSKGTEQSDDHHPVRRNITIDEPTHPPRIRSGTGNLTKSSLRRFGTNDQNKATPSILENVPSAARPQRSATWGSMRGSLSKEKDPMPYLSWQPTIGRNSAFVDLTEEQREELGGVEYRSLKTLALVLVCYFVLFHLLGIIILLPWIVRTADYASIVTGDGQSTVWWGIWTPASLFNDLGFTLTPDSMFSFSYAVLPLLFGSFLIVIGNTGFPCMLRFTIWVLSKVVPFGSGIWEELQFLLDHPRRCFTLLFPSAATWWLVWILIILNGLDVIFFIVLDIHDPTISVIKPPGYRVLDGLFQAVSTRTAGFAVVNLAALHPGIQVSYLIMMYISVFPIAISVRRTNVYEEKSLGIYGSSQEEDSDEHEPSYIGAHLRRQLSFDLWYVFLGLFIIAIVEGTRLQDNTQPAFSLFACLFEIVSAYGTVGLSLGYPNIDESFSAEFHVISKLVIIAMMVRGRHRGLPYELDRAILLPSESLHRKEDADAAKRVQRRNSNLSTTASVAGQGLFGPISNAGFATGSDIQANVNMHLEQHPSHARHGLGRTMAALAAGDTIAKEVTSGGLSLKHGSRGHTE